MKKKIIKIDEDTLELSEIFIEVEENTDNNAVTNFANTLRNAMGYTADEFYNKYKAYKNAEAEFKAIYEPLKAKIIELHEAQNLPKNIIVGGAKLTYVSPSVRTSIDSKKLKEEEPEIAKKFAKTTNVSATVKLEDIGG